MKKLRKNASLASVAERARSRNVRHLNRWREINGRIRDGEIAWGDHSAAHARGRAEFEAGLEWGEIADALERLAAKKEKA
jgi:hypothetical protein